MIDLAGARRAALVVAHPDDETLWCGGLLQRLPLDWTVIACSIPRRDPERAWKFFDACRDLGAAGRLLPFEETPAVENLRGLPLLALAGYDLVATHGAAGEYGHPHHRQVHHAVKATVPARLLTIGWRPDGAGCLRIDLTPAEAARKLAALRRYDHMAPSDGGKPKWQALVDRYVGRGGLDLGIETYDLA